MPAVVAAPYPAHREGDVVLRDGSTVHVRPVHRDDEPALLGFFRALSSESRLLRFFSVATDLGIEALRESQVDYRETFALVASAGPDQRLIGHAYYVATGQGRAEVALAIADDWQGRGLGTLLLGQLAEVAAASGIEVFDADVLPINHRMLQVFRESGFAVQSRPTPDAIHATLLTALDPAAREQFERREQLAAANAVRAIVSPRSVAVIGASRRRGTVGGEAFHNLLSAEFAGPVYPVNPSADAVQSVRAYPSVEAIPGPVDLAIVAVPATEVVKVAEQCARKGVRALVVLSAGFGEAGPEGRARQAELLRVCRLSGMRLVGPNCFGVLNTDPGVRLNGTFGRATVLPGRVGFASQSGALGLAAIRYAASLGLGISSFVSMGNKADISSNDLLEYWESDPNTDLVLLYLESFGNPRKFARIAPRLARSKPVVAVKSGRSPAGTRASSSHTGALLAASDVTVDALFRQAGVIRTDTLEELFEVAALLGSQPLPSGRRIGIVTNVGGPGILCADACAADGLEVPILAENTRARLREFLPTGAGLDNPVDLIATATAEQFRRAVSVVGADPGIDALVAIFLDPLATRAEDIASAISAGAHDLPPDKPIVAVSMTETTPTELSQNGRRIPAYRFPESAARALAHAARLVEWRKRPVEATARPEGVRRDEAAGVVAGALGRGGDGWLGPAEVAQLAACYGLPLVDARLAPTPEAAGAAAEALGGSVALKAVAAGLVHKTDAGGVRLALRGARATTRAAQGMARHLAAAGQPVTSFLVQQMAPSGVELLVGIVHDAQFGPVVACGAGGTLVELLKDVAVRLAPLARTDAAEMLRELKTYPLLTGFRGALPRDVGAVEELLVRAATLADDFPEIAELDCNPVVVSERGAVVVDARIRVQPVEPSAPLGARP